MHYGICLRTKPLSHNLPRDTSCLYGVSHRHVRAFIIDSGRSAGHVSWSGELVRRHGGPPGIQRVLCMSGGPPLPGIACSFNQMRHGQRCHIAHTYQRQEAWGGGVRWGWGWNFFYLFICFICFIFRDYYFLLIILFNFNSDYFNEF